MEQLIHTGPSDDSVFLKMIRATFIPNRVLIHIDPHNPPQGLAALNATVRALVKEVEESAGAVKVGENVRICENFTCGLPIEDVEELKHKLCPS